MQQVLLTDEQKMFREAVQEFVKRDVLPHHEQWEKDGIVSREVWTRAGENGFLCMDLPEEYGGLGLVMFSLQELRKAKKNSEYLSIFWVMVLEK